jgi:hypothetical protein
VVGVKAMFVYGQADNSRYALIKGAGLRDWLRDNKIPAMYSASRRGWHLRTERVGDVVALAEVDGYRVRFKGAL